MFKNFACALAILRRYNNMCDMCDIPYALKSIRILPKNCIYNIVHWIVYNDEYS